MNAQEANAIPMSVVLEKIGYQPSDRSNGVDLWYFSPFRKERTPSFHVNTAKNVWFDHGAGRGGTVIDFVCLRLRHYFEDHTVVDALRWLDTMVLKDARIASFPQSEPTKNQPALILEKPTFIQSPPLKEYLSSRGIPADLAKNHLKQVYAFNKKTRRSFYALGMKNESRGYELRNELFKGTLGEKNISFVRGVKTSEGKIHVFEGFLDFLTALFYQDNHRFEHDVIILNSLSNIRKAIPYIETMPYGKIVTWLDNDAAGQTATAELRRFALSIGFGHEEMNRVYEPYKDVNEWHMSKLGLPRP